MDEDEIFEDYSDEPEYKRPSEINQSALREALCNLNLFGDDLFLRMQAFNLAIVDPWITNLEYEVLRKLVDEERTPVAEASFLSAQSQMWIFATYELLRTWRQRAKEMVKWYENGGLELKLAALQEEQGYSHFGRESRAAQIKSVIDNPDRIEAVRRDLKRTHMLFARLEAIRISLAKHEVRNKSKSVALRPGYGRINSRCGALDYEIENGLYSLGYINRRDIADEIRVLLANDHIPRDEEIASFDDMMRGPPDDAFD